MRRLLLCVVCLLGLVVGCTSKEAVSHKRLEHDVSLTISTESAAFEALEHDYWNQEIHDHLVPLLYQSGDDDLYGLVGGLRAERLFGTTELPCRVKRINPRTHTEQLYILSYDREGRFVHMDSVTGDVSERVAEAQWDNGQLTHLRRTLPNVEDARSSYPIDARVEELVRETIGVFAVRDVYFDYDESSGRLLARRAKQNNKTTRVRLDLAPPHVSFHQEGLDAQRTVWTFDQYGRRVTPIMFESHGEWHRITFDESGRLLYWRDPHHIATYTRDDRGRLTAFEFSIYVGRGTCNSYGRITYDEHNRPLRVVAHHGCGGPLHSPQVVWEHDYACVHATAPSPSLARPIIL